MSKVWLLLEDGSEYQGESFGYEQNVSGEIVFNTAMTGYPESLTDPSYAGQMIVMTYPLVGNYGVPPFSIEKNGLSTNMESSKIQAVGIIVSDYSETFSHWNGLESLGSWLRREHIPGISGIDTRSLTKKLREHGVMQCKVLFEGHGSAVEIEDYSQVNFISRVSCKDITIYHGTSSVRLSRETSNDGINTHLPQNGLKQVLLVDCGVKENIIRCLLRRGVNVIRVPWDYDFSGIAYDGLFLANGPGDPDTATATVDNIRKSMQLRPSTPIFGICMGNQLLGKAGGAKIYKLKYGHRSHNQPVRECGTNRCYVTSQNHGYAVDDQSLGSDWEPFFVNMNDGSNEGIRHKTNPWFSVQFHPEASSGPTDTEYLFDEFIKLL